MPPSVRLVILAQMSLGLFLLVCFVLMPHFLLQSDEGGVSNYGTYSATIIPYTLAFGLCGVLTLQAARVFWTDTARSRQLRRVLFGSGWFYLAVLESTYLYQVSGLLDDIHIAVGVLLLVFQIATATWFGHVFTRDVLQTVLLAAQGAGFILAVLTLFGVLHVLFIAEVVTSLTFGWLLIRVVRQACPDCTDTKNLR